MTEGQEPREEASIGGRGSKELVAAKRESTSGVGVDLDMKRVSKRSKKLK
jgi:hypothetical protein